MQSMTIGSANTITKELRELDERIEVTGIGATGTSWCRRPRLWRTSFRVAKMEEEHEDRRHGIMASATFMYTTSSNHSRTSSRTTTHRGGSARACGRSTRSLDASQQRRSRACRQGRPQLPLGRYPDGHPMPGGTPRTSMRRTCWCGQRREQGKSGDASRATSASACCTSQPTTSTT